MSKIELRKVKVVKRPCVEIPCDPDAPSNLAMARKIRVTVPQSAWADYASRRGIDDAATVKWIIGRLDRRGLPVMKS